jgi:hypothetical protein
MEFWVIEPPIEKKSHKKAQNKPKPAKKRH